MLVLTRRPNEEVVLPDCGVTLKVIEIDGNRVKLAISAPDSVKIVRGEIGFEKQCEINMPASVTLPHRAPFCRTICQTT
jgi:carbon storage regulator